MKKYHAQLRISMRHRQSHKSQLIPWQGHIWSHILAHIQTRKRNTRKTICCKTFKQGRWTIYTTRKMIYYNNLDLLLVSADNSSQPIPILVDLPADINNILLVATVLRWPIPKIGVLFDIGFLSGSISILWFLVLAYLNSSYEILPTHFLWRLLKWAATQKLSMF
jgi:hypothetical protein